MDYIYYYHSPLGKITIAADGRSIIGLWFEKGRYYGSTLKEPYEENNDLPVFSTAVRWLNLYFTQTIPDFLPPLEIRKSEYTQKVCRLLLTVPYGKTISYSQLAEKMVKNDPSVKFSPRAAACALSHNPISLFIPCHRVIAKDGSLSGYSGGLERKKALLELEKSTLQKRAL